MNNRSKAVVPPMLVLLLSLLGCTTPAPAPPVVPQEEPEAIARTEFTDRIENFFEYEPLRAAKPSQFRIHLTDLNDGSPVAQAEVSLTVRRKGGGEGITQTTAKIGKVTGIYVAELSVPQSGEYDVEFHIKNQKLDERLSLTGFKVE